MKRYLVLLSYFVVSLTQITITAQAQEKVYREIQSLQQLPGIVNEINAKIKGTNGKIYIGFDLDNTITKINGCNLPLREGQTTLAVLKGLVNNKNVRIFIITSRSPNPQAGQDLKAFRQNLHTSLFANLIAYITNVFGSNIFGDSLIGEKLADADTKSISSQNYTIDNTFTYYEGGIISVPGLGDQKIHNKGRALRGIINNKVIDFDPQNDYLVFVDNNKSHINEAQDYLGDKVNLYTLYFPQIPELAIAKGDKCTATID
ncbi:MAG TPA: hypothetical protein VEL47_00840 [Myxococcota bacterium]|nr:hypothetical protein [Myxococcota bacterium]